MTPYAFMTHGQIVVDATSPKSRGDLDTVLDLIAHEVFHIGYGWRREARREVELADPALYQMLDGLHNEGVATCLGWLALDLDPSNSNAATMLERLRAQAAEQPAS